MLNILSKSDNEVDRVKCIQIFILVKIPECVYLPVPMNFVGCESDSVNAGMSHAVTSQRLQQANQRTAEWLSANQRVDDLDQ